MEAVIPRLTVMDSVLPKIVNIVTTRQHNPPSVKFSIDEEDYVADSLRSLLNQDVDWQQKTNILLFLCENCVQLLPSTHSVESVLSCLINQLIKGSRDLPEDFLVVCIQTSTTILISLEDLVKITKFDTRNGSVSSASTKLSDISVTNYERLLLRVLIDFVDGTVNNQILLSCVLQCLIELERNSPCVLGNYMHVLHRRLKEDKGPSSQLWKYLAVLTLKHLVKRIASDGSLSIRAIASALRGQQLPRKISNFDANLLPSFYLTFTSGEVLQSTSSDVRFICQSVIDSLYLLEPVVQLKMIESLIEIKMSFAEKSENIYSILATELAKRDDVVLCVASLMILRHYPSYRTVQEIDNLIDNIGSGSRHINKYHLKSLYRLKMTESACLISQVSIPSKYLQPSVIEASPLVLEKIIIFSHNLLPLAENYDSVELSFQLLNLLSLFQRQVYQGIMGYTAVALFRAMFNLYITYPTLENDVFDYILAMNLKHHSLSTLTSDFLTSVSSLMPSSGLPTKLLRSFMNYFIKLPHATFLGRLNHYLPLMAAIAAQPTINLKEFICVLERTLQDSALCDEGSWEIGEGLLLITRNILQFQPEKLYFDETVFLLEVIQNRFNNEMIAESAALYITVSTSLSADRVQEYFANFPVFRSEVKHHFDTLLLPKSVAEEETKMAPITILPDEALVHVKSALKSRKFPVSVTTCAHLESYFDVSKPESINLKFELSFSATFDKSPIHALELTWGETPSFEGAPYMFIDTLESASELEVKLKCEQPAVPTDVPICAVFTDSHEQTCFTKLADFSIEFSDFFTPLPCSNKFDAFNWLWGHLKQQVTIEQDSALDTVFDCCFNGSKAELQERISEFFTDDMIVSDAGADVIFIGIFLPPADHLLMKVRRHENFVVFHCVVSNCSHLQYLSSYLWQIEKVLNTA